MALDIDQVLEQIGSMGRYQIRFISAMCYLGFFVSGFQTMIMTFIATEPGWRCVTNSTLCNATGVYRPGDVGYNDRCDRKLPSSEWEYEDTFTSTVTEWDLICDKSILGSVSSSVIFAGWLIGNVLLGWISDKFGRRKPLYFTVCLAAVFGFAGAFSPLFWLFVSARFFVGFMLGGSGLVQFVLITELVGIQHRHSAGIISFFAWATSLMTIPLFAYFIRDWKLLNTVLSALGLPSLFFWWLIPESPRWLLVKGKVEQAEKGLAEIARFNGKEMPQEPLLAPVDGEKSSGGFRDLFATLKMSRITLVSWFGWFVNSMVYYGVSLSAPVLGGNMYLNFFLISALEVPANYATIFCNRKFGRKKTVIVPMVLAALASMGAVLLTSNNDETGFFVGRILMALTAKFFITVSFNAIYVFSAELFPTVVRNTGMGTSSGAGRIGSFCSSYIVWLTRIHALLPYGIMGIGAFVAAMLCLTLPETKDQPTAELVLNDVSDVAVKERKENLDSEDEKMEFTSRLYRQHSTGKLGMRSAPPYQKLMNHSNETNVTNKAASSLSIDVFYPQPSSPVQHQVTWKEKSIAKRLFRVIMDADEILEEIGSFGFFQKRNAVFLGLIIFVLTFQTVSMVFIGGEPTWRCTANSSVCTQNATISPDDDYYKARCNMSSEDWEFTTEFTSIVTEWNLICGKEYFASLSQSMLFIGWIPGAFIIGRLSDKFGRRRVLFPAVFVVAVTSFASSFVPVFWLFLTLRGITGFFQGGVYITLYVLVIEFVGPKHRSFVGTLMWIFYTSSLMLLSGLAYGIREWRTLSIVISVPAFPLLIFWRWVPESCRWLIVHNKAEEAVKVFSSIASANNANLPDDKLHVEMREQAVNEGGFLDLFRTKTQCVKTLILWLCWFTNSMVYYGVLLSVGVLGGSLYLNFFLTSVIDIPSNIFVMWFMGWQRPILCKRFYGRKRALILCMTLAAVFCLIVSVIQELTDSGVTALRIIFAVLGKFCINASFSTIYVFSTELLPTVIRNVGMGSMAVFDQTGASIAPFVVLLGKTHPVIPFAIMSGFAFTAGCLCGLLPETLGKHTLETLKDTTDMNLRQERGANEPLVTTPEDLGPRAI
ncbi:uncharacterized protein [Porites lutea]|uniref:uncharacterized protein n=1 Tax=Porites lutea TaxID=51062 RepID=UPI003CC6D03F